MDGRFLHANALTKEKLAQIEALNKMAGERGQSLAQMALSWILKDEDVTSVLIGASRPEQIIQNVEIVQNTKFTREELKKIDQISRGNHLFNISFASFANNFFAQVSLTDCPC